MTRCDTYTGFPVGAAAAVAIADVDAYFEVATSLDACSELVDDVALEYEAFVAGAATAKSFWLTILAKISNEKDNEDELPELEAEVEAEAEVSELEVIVLFTDTIVDVS
ncbi:hypothetical protein BHYA_0259g00120 [Botrytis hyacinthi]|uniref:Uncharacterized protein n=1 Tax=Botrytis hyacinthi TaxID=278943 RepID=A0A4Z1GCN5_9HELO|nr:hypothetical protein BHYA_0259g00120 [Botrytis hyacinthi]